jgi:predicted nucleic acid-binding protein
LIIAVIILLFDDPSSPTIIFEAFAKVLIQRLILSHRLALVSSFIMNEEVAANTYDEKRNAITEFLQNAEVYIAKDNAEIVLSLAQEIMKTGIKYMDAAHVACAIVGGCDYLITTDKRLLKYTSDIITLINPIDFIRMWDFATGKGNLF